MTAIQAQLNREIAAYTGDEDILQKVLDYFRALTRKKPDPTEMTKDDFLAKLEHSRQQAQRGEVYSKRENETFDQLFTRLQNELQS